MATILNTSGIETTSDLSSMPEGGGLPSGVPFQPYIDSAFVTEEQEKQRKILGWKTDATRQLDSLILDWDNASKGKDFKLGYDPDPERAKKRGIVSSYLTIQNNGQPIPGGDMGPGMMRDRIAMQRFGGRGVGSDDAFYAEIAKESSERKSTKELYDGIAEESTLAAITGTVEGPEKAQTFEQWMEKAKAGGKFKPGSEFSYREAWESIREQSLEKMDRFGPELNQVWQAFKAGGAGTPSEVGKSLLLDAFTRPMGTGSEGMASSTSEELGKKDAAAIAADVYKTLDPEDRADFMDSLGQMADSMSKEERATFFGNLAKQSGRGIDRLIQNIGSIPGSGSDIRGLGDFVSGAGPTGSELRRDLDIPGMLEARNFASDVRRIEQGRYNPVKSAFHEGDPGWLEGGIYGIPEALASTAVALVPYVGQVAIYSSVEGTAYDTVRNNLKPQLGDEKASAMAAEWAPIIAAPTMAIERLQASALLGKFPILEKTLNRMTDQITNTAMRAATRTVAGAVEQTASEMVQDYLPSVAQDMAHAMEQEIPDVQWRGQGGVFDGFWTQFATTMVSMSPLAVGSGLGGVTEEGRARAFQQATDNQLRAFGVNQAGIDSIRAAQGQSSLNTAIDQALSTRDPNSEVAKAAVAAEDAEIKRTLEQATVLSDSGAFPSIVQSPDGFIVSDKNTGASYGPVATSDEAVKLAQGNFTAAKRANDEQIAYLGSMLDAVSSATDTKTSTELDLATVMSPTMAEQLAPGASNRIKDQLSLIEKAQGLTEDFAGQVFGMSQTDFEMNQRKTINRLFAGSTVATVFHEQWHGQYAEALQSGRITRDEALEFAMTMDALFKEAKNKRQLHLNLFPDGITSDQVTDTMLDEAISQIAEAEVLKSRKGGRDRDGEGRQNVQNIKSGFVTKNIKSLSGRGMKAAKKFSSLFDAVRQYFGVAMGRAIVMRQAERSGKFDRSKYDEMVARITGLTEQDTVANEAAKVGQEIAGDSTISPDPSFSVGPEIIDPLISNAINRIEDPKQKARMMGNIVTRLQKLRQFVEARGVAFNFDAFGKKFEGEFSDEKTSILNALATLDAILAAMPPDLRGRVGGYTNLAKQDTEEKRRDYLKRRLNTAERVIDNYLKKEYGKLFDKLLDRAEAKRKGGDKATGSLGAEGHRFFDKVTEVSKMTESQVDAESLRIDQEIADTDPNDIKELLRLSEDFQILNTFGNFENKSLQEMASALELAQSIFDEKRNIWKMKEEVRLLTTRDLAKKAIKDLGGSKTANVQRSKAKAAKLLEAVQGGKWSIKSFAEVLEGAFGIDSEITKRWSTLVRKGFQKRTSAIVDAQKRWKKATEEATGKKGRASRREIWKMATEQNVKAVVSPVSTETIKVPIDTFFDSENRKSLGLTDQEVATLTEQFEALPENSRKKYLALERQTKGESEAANFTEAEAIYLSMLWSQDGYKDAMRKHGMGEEFQSDLEDGMSDAAKQMRGYLATEYAGNYEPLRELYAKMFGVDLRQTINYTPGKFFSTGEDNTMDVTGSGFVDGGLKNGFLKDRKKHSAEARAENAFSVYFNHLNQTEHWKAMAEVSREMHGVLGNPEVKKALAGKNHQIATVLSEWMKAIDGNGFNNPKMSWLLDAITTSQAYLAMSWKLSTIVKNAMGATINAAYRMPHRSYALGMSRLMSGQIDFQKIWDSEIIQNRLDAGFAPEMRAAISSSFGAEPTARGDFLLKGMEVIGTADAFGTAIGAAITYDYHYREAIRSGVSKQDAETIAMNEAAETISRTAQPVEITDRSLMELRLNGIGKIAFVFASEARQKSSLWLTAWGNTLTGKATKKDLRVLLLSHVVMAPIMHAIGAMIRDSRDPEDDEWFDDKYWNPQDFLVAMATGPLGGIPLIRDVFDGYNGESGPLKRIVDSGASLKRLFMDEPKGDELDWYERNVTKVLQGLSPSIAVGASIFDQVYDFVRNATDD